MPHSFVVAQFNPGQSAYWLPPSGRRAATKLVTEPFWALRFDLYEQFEHENDPHFLCAVSSNPSPQQVPNASFTIGPKRCIYPPGVWFGNYDLGVVPPIISYPGVLLDNLYLHATPAISIFGAQQDPIRVTSLQLEPESLKYFRPIAKAHHVEMPAVWRTQRKVHWSSTQHAAILSSKSREDTPISGNNDTTEDNMDQWSTFTEPADPLYMFGQLNNPRAYCFDFDFSSADSLPFPDYANTIYDEIFKYIQICKDYRKPSVEAVIAWVRATRDADHCGKLLRPSRSCAPLTNPKELLKNDPLYHNAADDLSHASLVSRDGHTGNTGMLSEGDIMTEGNSQYSKVDSEEWQEFYYLPWLFHSMNHLYPEVPLGRPRVIAFDMFGTILDRDRAIRDALEPWSAIIRHPQSTEDVIKLYTELEALESRRQSDRCTPLPKVDLVQNTLALRQPDPVPTSLATIVHAALGVLAKRLGVPAESEPGLTETALTCILRPKPYADVVTTIDTLARRHILVVCIAPYSATTLDFLRPSLPPRIEERVVFCPIAISCHTHVPQSFFPALLEFGMRFAPGLQPKELLIASPSVGRVLASASLMGHSTAHVKRPHGLEANVKFMIGTHRYNPKPSITVDGLGELCRNLPF
ncbi:hypothetical protein C8Q78DRAFT_1073104 [Trametes maxima]|nr:hypothetical protein C8Q78DRAFT_1073104 [Trametes maxima]